MSTCVEEKWNYVFSRLYSTIESSYPSTVASQWTYFFDVRFIAQKWMWSTIVDSTALSKSPSVTTTPSPLWSNNMDLNWRSWTSAFVGIIWWCWTRLVSPNLDLCTGKMDKKGLKTRRHKAKLSRSPLHPDTYWHARTTEVSQVKFPYFPDE